MRGREPAAMANRTPASDVSLQDGDAFFQRRMAHEQALEAVADAAADAEGGELAGRQVLRLAGSLQAAQGVGHLPVAGEVRAAGVGLEFPVAGEPHHDHGRQDGEQDLSEYGHDVVGRAMALLGLEDQAVDQVPDDSGEEDDEGVHHPLEQGQGYHIAVGYMADFMAHHGLYLVPGHMLE